MVDGLFVMNYILIIFLDLVRCYGVVVVYFDDLDEGVVLYEWLYVEYCIGVVLIGGLWICLYIYNIEEYIDRFLVVINEY